MVSNTVYLLCCALGSLHLTEAKCRQSLVAYWKREYFKNYVGDLEPWRRCKEERGTCMRKPDSCGSGDWKRYQTECYNRCDCCFRKKTNINHLDWVLVKERVTWEEARKDCKKYKNGELVVPENVASLLTFIKKQNIGSSDVWIGINEKFTGRFEGIHGNKVYGGWMKGQPLPATSGTKRCVVVENGSSRRYKRKRNGMKVESCWDRNYYVCDVNGSNRKRHNVVYKPTESGEVYHDEDNTAEVTLDENIKIFDDKMTWYDARADCQERGGDLLVPHSIGDLASFIDKNMIEERDIWLGINDHQNPGDYLGIHGNKILDKSVWQPLQPREQKIGDDCVVIANGDIMGKALKVKPCKSKLPYACDLSGLVSTLTSGHRIEKIMVPHPIAQ